jgi:hypothetical protein
MKPKPDYQKLYETEKREHDVTLRTVDKLRIERDAAEKRYQEMVVKASFAEQAHINIKHGYDTRIPKEITVEKEVLPLSAVIMFFVMALMMVSEDTMVIHTLKKLETPILEPYPVYTTLHTVYPASLEALDTCHDAWRADERTIRKLRKGSP